MDHPTRRAPKECPSCGSKALRGHCASPSCAWILCLTCKHWGTADGKKWQPLDQVDHG